jgi:hypothetical protein
MSPVHKKRSWTGPINPGRLRGLSRLTIAFALGFPIAIVVSLVGVFTLFALFPKGLPPAKAYLFYPLTAIEWLGAATIPIALALFLKGWVDDVKWRKARDQARLQAGRQAQDDERADLRVKAQGVLARLEAIYAEHNDALVAQAKELLKPDRYGRRDTAAAAQEFAAFQDTVVVPALTQAGYPSDLIAPVFETKKAELLANVLRQVEGAAAG